MVTAASVNAATAIAALQNPMISIKTSVTNGRIVVDHATNLAEGSEVELIAVMDDAEDALDAGDGSALHRSVASAAEDIQRLVDGDEVLDRLRSRG